MSDSFNAWPACAARMIALVRGERVLLRAKIDEGAAQRIVTDAFAPYFLTAGTRAVLRPLVWATPLRDLGAQHELGGLSTYVLCRHRFIDEHLLQAIDLQLSPPREVAIVAPGGEDDSPGPLAREVRSRFRPHDVLAGRQDSQPTSVPLLQDRTAIDGRAAAYVCERFACQVPVTEVDALRALLAS